jgi:2-polyprenyl-3-methyl-5-hydroxy-6-metoxy-1,4-benzoquinol methylase
MKAEQFNAHAEAEKSHWWFIARRQILRSLIHEVLPPSRDNLVIDVGCGTGGNVSVLGQDYRIIGIDPAVEAISIAQQTFPDHKFIQGQAPEALGDFAKQADVFLLSDVLEHVQDDFLLLSKLLEVAKPGAMFVIAVPADMRLWSLHDVSHDHYRRYDRDRLHRLWHDLPVETCLLSYFNSRAYYGIRLVRTFTKLFGGSYGGSDTDLRIPPKPVNSLLASLFAGERIRLRRALMDDDNAGAYSHGVSLIAIIRKLREPIPPRTRPGDVPLDLHGPGID